MQTFVSWQRLLLPILAASLIAASGCATAGSGRPNVPSLALQDARGRIHYLSDYIGRKVVVMTFLTTWSQPCRQELLMLEDIYRQYKEQGLEVLGISSDGPETQSAVRNFVVQQGLTFPILNDADTRVVSLYNPRKQEPMLHIFSKTGRLLFSYPTFQPGETALLRSKILSVLLRGTIEEPPAERAKKLDEESDKESEGEGKEGKEE